MVLMHGKDGKVMKTKFRKLISAAAAVSVVCSAFTGFAHTAFAAEDAAYSVDFESEFAFADQWTQSDGAAYEIAEETDSDGNTVNKYLKLTSSADNQQIKYNFIGDSREIKSGTDFTVTYRVKFDSQIPESGIPTDKLLISKNNSTSGFETQRWKTAFSYQSEATASNKKTKLTDLQTGTWYNFRWVYDSTNNDSLKLYINEGEKECTVYNRSSVAFDSLIFGLGNDMSVIGIDDIKIYSGKHGIPQSKKYINTEFNGFSVTKGEDGKYTPSMSDMASGVSVSVNNMEDSSTIAAIGGKFGKDASDTSIYLHNNAVSDASAYLEPYLQMNPPKASYITNEGDSQTLSFNCAFDGTMRPIRITGAVNNDAVWTSVKNYIMSLTPTSVNVLGASASIAPALVAEKWYNVVINVTRGDEYSTVDLYIDGKKIIDNGTVTAQKNNTTDVISKFGGFCSIRLDYYCSKEQRAAEGGIYFDDVKLVSHTNGASYTAPETKASITKGTVDFDRWIMSDYVLYQSAETTVGDIKNGLGEEEKGIKSVTFRDASGNSLSDSDKTGTGIFAEITDINDNNVYVKIIGGAKEFLGAANEVKDVSEIGTGRGNVGKWGTTNSVNAVEGGKGSKDLSDIAIKITPENTADQAYIDYCLQTDSGKTMVNEASFRPLNVSFNVLLPDKETAFYAVARSTANVDSGSKVFQNIVTFKNGAVNGGFADEETKLTPVIGAYNANEWNRISYTIVPGNGVTVSLNGTPVYYVENLDYTAVLDIRFSANGTAYIDDVKMSTGYFDAETAPSAAFKDEITGADGRRVISADYSDYTVSELIAERLLTVSGDMRVFTDNTYAVPVSSDEYADNGAVIVVKKDDIYKYIEVYSGFALSGGTVSCGAKDGDILYAGVYNSDNTLAKAAMSSDVKDGTLSCSAEAGSGQTVKAYLWSSQQQAIVPLEVMQ